MNINTFQKKILTWYHKHGRKDLPWQQNITPYRVWVSEIMLQQTQVKTVIPYFKRFMQHFPTVHKLAKAPLDEVLHLWTGLGYYSRARNLHKAAQTIVSEHNGKFSDDVDTLSQLPGIGRSTAGAIVSTAFEKPAAILDGNVKRVLARFHCVEGWSGSTTTAKQLWHIAERYTPNKNNRAYTQAMMDLGAMICTRTKPQCTQCPLQKDCQAHNKNCVNQYPNPKPKKTIPTRHVQFLLLHNQNNELLLIQRPPAGIWGGLWCFPDIAMGEDPHVWCEQELGIIIDNIEPWPSFKHTFSHFHLHINPIVTSVTNTIPTVMSSTPQIWYNHYQPTAIGFAAPIKKLLQQWRQQLEVNT